MSVFLIVNTLSSWIQHGEQTPQLGLRHTLLSVLHVKWHIIWNIKWDSHCSKELPTWIEKSKHMGPRKPETCSTFVGSRLFSAAVLCFWITDLLLKGHDLHSAAIAPKRSEWQVPPQTPEEKHSKYLATVNPSLRTTWNPEKSFKFERGRIWLV